MSRSCYSEDYGEEFPGQLELFRANVARSMRSKAGQARLTELRDALLALPKKELEAEIFAEDIGGEARVCALGAWALAKAGGDVYAAHAMVPNGGDDHDTYDALKPHGWPRLVVLEAVYMNDEGGYGSETPTQRYVRVLAWVRRELGEAADAVDPHVGGSSE